MICQVKGLQLKFRSLGLISLFVLGVLPALADQSVILGWQPSPDPNAVGYNIYYGTASHSYTSKLSVGNVTNATVSGLILGKVYYFAVTSYDVLNQESRFSNEASYTVTKPTLSIVSPASGQQWSNGAFTVTGKAADNVAVAKVCFSLNGSAWTNATTANNWTNWSGSLALTPGTNTLQAYALDTSGNPSTTNTISFVDVALKNLTTITPPKTITLTSLFYLRGKFSFNVSGEANYQCIVQVSTNRVDWISAETNMTPFTFTDVEAGQFKERYYRTVGN
jgi:hypothetical protein